MADVDIDPFSEHDKPNEHPDEWPKKMGKTIPIDPGGSTWKPECEQETSFGLKAQSTRLMKLHVVVLYKKLSKVTNQNPGVIHLDHFQRRGKKEPLTYGGKKLRTVTQIMKILGKEGLCDLDFEILRSSKVTAQQAIMLNRVEEELPSAPDISDMDDIEL